ncbi:MAG: type 1 glutamine amidotransferase [Gaiellales bacterium]
MSDSVRILVVQNDDDKHAGRIGRALEDAGAELAIAMAYGAIPDVAEVDGLLVLPGLGDPVDDEQAIHDARDAIVAARELGRPVLGVCLGGQLLAQSAGAEIYRSTPELGIHPVRTTPAAQDDPLFRGIPTEYESFHAHAFAFRPVPDATVLIESDACCQAMRIGDRSWALQLHPEMTREGLHALARAIEYDFDGGILPETAVFFRDAGVDPVRLREQADALDELHTAIAAQIGRGFVDACRSARAERAS